MKIEVVWMDVTEHLRRGEQPVYLVERPKAHEEPKAWAGTSEIARVGEFWTLQALKPDGSIELSKCVMGDLVRIPINGFLTGERALAAVWGLGLQVGLATIAELRKHTSDVPSELKLVLGHEVHDMNPQPAYRCYAGVCLRTQ